MVVALLLCVHARALRPKPQPKPLASTGRSLRSSNGSRRSLGSRGSRRSLGRSRRNAGRLQNLPLDSHASFGAAGDGGPSLGWEITAGPKKNTATEKTQIILTQIILISVLWLDFVTYCFVYVCVFFGCGAVFFCRGVDFFLLRGCPPRLGCESRAEGLIVRELVEVSVVELGGGLFLHNLQR